MDIPEDLARAGTSFGGGVGLTKNLCGCITAAGLAVGLKYGHLEPTGTAPRQAYARTKAIVDKFQQKYGTLNCRDLTGQFQDFASRERVYRCAEIVDFVFQELREVLSAPEERPEWQEGWWQDYLARRDKVR